MDLTSPLSSYLHRSVSTTPHRLGCLSQLPLFSHKKQLQLYHLRIWSRRMLRCIFSEKPGSSNPSRRTSPRISSRMHRSRSRGVRSERSKLRSLVRRSSGIFSPRTRSEFPLRRNKLRYFLYRHRIFNADNGTCATVSDSGGLRDVLLRCYPERARRVGETIVRTKLRFVFFEVLSGKSK